MNLLPIANKLQELGFGTVGQDIFYDKMPVGVKRGLLVTTQTQIKRNEYASGYRSGTLQIISRQLDDEDYQDPREILENVITAISGEGKQIGSMRFLQFRARHDPFVFPKSDGNNIEASVNFDIIFTV